MRLFQKKFQDYYLNHSVNSDCLSTRIILGEFMDMSGQKGHMNNSDVSTNNFIIPYLPNSAAASDVLTKNCTSIVLIRKLPIEVNVAPSMMAPSSTNISVKLVRSLFSAVLRENRTW